ncbi:MAG: hypothetical protein J0L73_19255 [Verrucomicrobia bacterium]|nr:hypothetical protein [Verrucomicrobiota bacterium]
MHEPDIPPSIRTFISRYVRSVEQMEIMLLFSRNPGVAWSVQKVYDAILSTPKSVQKWLDELVRDGLLEKLSEPAASYRCSTKDNLITQMNELGDLYRTKPVRIIEAIYRRDDNAAQSFADAFKIKTTDQSS